jgi:hypothetical protein
MLREATSVLRASIDDRHTTHPTPANRRQAAKLRVLVFLIDRSRFSIDLKTTQHRE